MTSAENTRPPKYINQTVHNKLEQDIHRRLLQMQFFYIRARVFLALVKFVKISRSRKILGLQYYQSVEGGRSNVY